MTRLHHVVLHRSPTPMAVVGYESEKPHGKRREIYRRVIGEDVSLAEYRRVIKRCRAACGDTLKAAAMAFNLLHP